MDGNGVSHPNKILFSQLEIRWNKSISGHVSSGCRRLQSHRNLDTLTKHRGQHHHGWSEISPLCCRSKRSLPKTGHDWHDYSKQSLKFARCYMSGIKIYRDAIGYIHLHPRSPQGCSPLQTIYPDIIFFVPANQCSRDSMTMASSVPQPMYAHILSICIWLVVDLPLCKIWVRQLGWVFPIYGKIKIMFQTTNQIWINHQPEERHLGVS